jgi:hypothetical protein
MRRTAIYVNKYNTVDISGKEDARAGLKITINKLKNTKVIRKIIIYI